MVKKKGSQRSTPAKGAPEIVGATLVAAHAGEMISELTLAITNKLTMQALAETVHCYPTQAEVFQRIALSYKPEKTTSGRPTSALHSSSV